MGFCFVKRAIGVLVVAVFLFVSGPAFAADEKWVVIKDSKGVCKVIKAKEKTPKTIAGPFASKDEANKAKEAKCPKKSAE
ncbi:MAG: hypothetical protein RDU20_17280 [Desulfomonilaceae bacterium]|nr:hypothetical protein [Desulfomonilaceae bacterium]